MLHHNRVEGLLPLHMHLDLPCHPSLPLQWGNITSRNPSELRELPSLCLSLLVSATYHRSLCLCRNLRPHPRPYSSLILATLLHIEYFWSDISTQHAVTSLSLTLGAQAAVRSVIPKTFDDMCLPRSLTNRVKKVDTAINLVQFAYDPNQVSCPSTKSQKHKQTELDTICNTPLPFSLSSLLNPSRTPSAHIAASSLTSL